jgi:hypothetical protein
MLNVDCLACDAVVDYHCYEDNAVQKKELRTYIGILTMGVGNADSDDKRIPVAWSSTSAVIPAYTASKQ